MKTIFKRMLGAILCLCMLLSLVPVGFATESTAVASVTIGGETTEYETLAAAITAVRTATAEDAAVVTLLNDTVISTVQQVYGGVFTLDLNGCTISSSESDFIGYSILNVMYAGTEVEIIDSGENGTISGPSYGIFVENGAKLTVSDGTVSGETAVFGDGAETVIEVSGGALRGLESGLYTSSGTLRISGGTITAEGSEAYNFIFGVYVNGCTDVNITSGEISATGTNAYGELANALCAYSCSVNISGGSFSSDGAEFFTTDSDDFTADFNLMLDENSKGASFPTGISASGTTLDAILGEGVAFWADGKMLNADGATELTGNIAVASACTHEDAVLSYTDNGDNHTFTYSCCGYCVTEDHSYDTATTECVCGAVGAKTYVVTIDGVDTNYTDFNTAIDAACAAESATLTLHEDVPVSSYYFRSGKVTLDLNGKTVQTRLNVSGCTLTVTDSAETKGTIVNYAGAAFGFYSGKLILLNTVDLVGETEGHEAFYITTQSDEAVSAAIGSTGTEAIVLPESVVAISNGGSTAVSVMPEKGYAVILHRHHWVEPTCTKDGYCTDCDTPGTQKLGHSIDEDGICTVCGVDTNAGIIEMTDDYGDGWNGNAIEVYENGVLIATATIEDGSSNTCTFSYNAEKGYVFVWCAGDYPGECSFVISVAGETFSYSGEDLSDGEKFLILCTHSYGEGVEKPATCTQDGGTYYTCTKCGENHAENVTSATGHTLGEDGSCTVCGCTPVTITFNLSDSYGDGWDSNALAVYCGDELISTITISSGSSASQNVEIDAAKDYKVLWIKGSYPDECSFEVLIDGESVFTKEDCSAYADEELLFYIIDGELVLPDHGVYVGGVVLESGDYLDLNGNVTETRPEGGYAYYKDRVLTLNNFSYTGSGYDYPNYELGVLIYSENTDLEIKAEGTNTLTGTGFTYGIMLGDVTNNNQKQELTLSGSGTLNLSGESLWAACVTDIIINGGIWNISAVYGFFSSSGDSTLTINGGKLSIAALGVDGEQAVFMGDTTINGGKVTLSSQSGIALDCGILTVNSGYLEVTKGGMTAWSPNAEDYIVLGKNVAITSPADAIIGTYTNSNNLVMDTISNADGTMADSFVIKDTTGWTEIDGDWSYIDPESGEKVTGLKRVPYPTEEINGITYAPDADAVEYCEANGTTFIDATEGWFLFDENGVFQSDFTGIDEHYYKNGFMLWHPGLIESEGEYYYFTGDAENGGNKTASGNVYVSTNQTDLDITIGGIYTFDENGKLCKYDGITDVDGTLYYYEDYQLMIGKGLIELDGDYYYVRSDGSLVVDQSYWVENNNGLDIPVGEYEFDENGKLIVPVTTVKHGIYEERGAWYYYENGVRAYNKGLIVTDLNWYDEDGNDVWSEGATIYVRSNGRLATSKYFVTNVSNYDGEYEIKAGSIQYFDEMGKLVAAKNGIYEVNGVLRYYIDNVMQYGSGVVLVDGNYYYVRSNGEVVRDCEYYVTTVGVTGVLAGRYHFDENGVMQDPRFADSGVLNGYYYENGDIVCGKGLVYLEDEGCYIYVRSNGAVAIGKYWITVHNDLLPAGLYDFGTDGRLYI